MTVLIIVAVVFTAIAAMAAFTVYVTWKEETKCDLEIVLKEEKQ